MKMKKLTQRAIVAAVAVVIVAGAAGLIGSNMGFKAVRDFNYNTAPAATNRHSIALPHNSPWADSEAFLMHLCTSQPSPVDLTLFNYDNSTGLESFQTIFYSCGAFQEAAFSIVPGVAYELSVPEALTGVTLVGSQNPSWVGGTLAYNTAPAATNRHNLAVTPNTKWATSADLLQAFCDFQASPVDLTLFSYDNSTGLESFQTIFYSCGAFQEADIPLVPFAGYSLGVPEDVNWPPVPYY